MLRSTQGEDEDVALEACEFWISIAEQDLAKDFLIPHLGAIFPVLLQVSTACAQCTRMHALPAHPANTLVRPNGKAHPGRNNVYNHLTLPPVCGRTQSLKF